MNRLRTKTRAMALILSCFAPLSALANPPTIIEQYGVTYSINETDALAQIRAAAAHANFKKVMSETPRKDWSAFQGQPLPRATKTQTRDYVPWYVTPWDIKNAKGRVLYPKGFRFNPLQYTFLPQRIVVLKLDQYPKMAPYLKDTDLVIADSGDVIEAGIKYHRNLKILDKPTRTRLGIKVVPSIITQVEQHLVIQEINLAEPITGLAKTAQKAHSKSLKVTNAQLSELSQGESHVKNAH